MIHLKKDDLVHFQSFFKASSGIFLVRNWRDFLKTDLLWCCVANAALKSHSNRLLHGRGRTLWSLSKCCLELNSCVLHETWVIFHVLSGQTWLMLGSRHRRLPADPTPAGGPRSRPWTRPVRLEQSCDTRGVAGPPSCLGRKVRRSCRPGRKRSKQGSLLSPRWKHGTPSTQMEWWVHSSVLQFNDSNILLTWLQLS